VALTALLFSWSFSASALSSAGDLDLSFGGDGKVSTSFSYAFQLVQAIAVQPDGKVVAAGIAGNSPHDDDFALARYNGDGTLDSTFGTGGRVTTDFFGNSDEIFGIALLPQGQILVAGSAYNSQNYANFAIARYNFNGTLDTTFGSGGKVLTDFFGSDSGARALVVLDDGKILVAGWAYHGGYTDCDWALVRYDRDGSLDASFGENGRVVTEINGNGSARSIGIQSTGKIVLGGEAWGDDTGDWDFGLTRYKPSGKLDKSFGTDGKVITDFFGEVDSIAGLGIQPDDKIVAAGTANADGTSNFGLARFNPNGTLDSSFGSGGKVKTKFSNTSSVADAIIIQSDEKIVAAGHTWGAGADFALARYNTDGSLDSTFGTSGKLQTDFFQGNDEAYAATLAPDGRIIVGGIAQAPRGGDAFAVACYLAKGTPNITGAEVRGKKLFVYGANFDDGSEVYLDEEKQKTANDSEHPDTILIGKKAGKKIAPGQTVMLRVKCPDGRLSNEFSFTRPIE
jgi:uncharacterized delta-60 repeat protein